MDTEFSSLRSNNTWTLCQLPKGRRAIGTKWVYKTKLKGNGDIDRLKAPLVAKGFTQKKRTDFDETFAPVARTTSVRVIFAIAAAENFILEQLDVDSAYLNGLIDKEIYMAQPQGYVDAEHPTWVCRLNKSLYGLKQAGRIWNDVAHSYVMELEFTHSNADPCVYVRTTQERKLILGLYVDDFILAGLPPRHSSFHREDRVSFFLQGHG